MNNLFISLILVSLCIGQTIGISTLLLKNELSNQYLAIRCRSKDDHLGEHYLPVGATKKFNFNDNVWRRTLFWCRMYKGPDYKVHQVFDAYRSKWKSEYGPTYMWIGRDDGVYFSQTGKPPVKRYGWNHTAP